MSGVQEARRGALVELIRSSGMSIEAFSRRVVARSPSTVYRWLSGDRPIPALMGQWIAGDGERIVESIAQWEADND